MQHNTYTTEGRTNRLNAAQDTLQREGLILVQLKRLNQTRHIHYRRTNTSTAQRLNSEQHIHYRRKD